MRPIACYSEHQWLFLLRVVAFGLLPHQPHAEDVEAPTKVTHADVRGEARRWWIDPNTRVGEFVSGGSIPRGFHSNASLRLSPGSVCSLCRSQEYAECVRVVVCVSQCVLVVVLVRVFWSTG